ncbi:hypothetical protein AVEN_190819-1 [Araneus ventricosus]|uniref:Uncharacterized protein n=1 Tax=Araneus ventricosus TaxID=182803 RepID=A0A4Y2DZI6_ARAVE|nr:hypothetical protein AVEN_190819-1 [Araneus ventricosus]
MAKTAKVKFALCTKEIQCYKEQDIEVLDDLKLWDELRRDIEGLKCDLRDSYLAWGDELDNLYRSFIGVKDMAIDILAKIRRLMAKAQESRESVKIEDSSKSGISELSSLRLSGLELPTFHGDLGTWLTFREVFAPTIDINKYMSEASKFNYLIEALKGDPAKLVSGFSMSVFLIQLKFDESLRQQWELTMDKDSLPSHDELVKFLENHARSRQVGNDNNTSEFVPVQKSSVRTQPMIMRKSVSNAFVSENSKFRKIVYPQCGDCHLLCQYPRIQKLTVEQRWSLGNNHTILHEEERKPAVQSAVERPGTLMHERNVEQVRLVDQDQKPDFLSECKSKYLGCFFTRANDSNMQVLLSSTASG